MFCNRSKSGQPNSSDELVPQAPSTTYELIWACWKRTQRAATVVIVANSTPLLCLSHYYPSRQSFDGGDLGELQLLVSMFINRLCFFKIFLSYCCLWNKHPWWIREQIYRNIFKTNPVNATYHLPCRCTRSFSLPPTFPFCFGTMGAPLRVQVRGG